MVMSSCQQTVAHESHDHDRVYHVVRAWHSMASIVIGQRLNAKSDLTNFSESSFSNVWNQPTRYVLSFHAYK